MEVPGKLCVSRSYDLASVLLVRKRPVVLGVPRRILAGGKGLTHPGAIPVSTEDLQNWHPLFQSQHRVKRSDTKDQSSFGRIAKLNDDRWKN